MSLNMQIRRILKYKIVIILSTITFLVASCASKSDESGKDTFDSTSLSEKSTVEAIESETSEELVKEKRGLVKENGATYLYDEEGNLLKDYLYKKNRDYYYANSSGKIVINTWVQVLAKNINSNFPITDTKLNHMYFGSDGKALKNITEFFDFKKHTFDKNGFLISDTIEFKGRKYDFDLKDFIRELKGKNIGDLVIFGKCKQDGEEERAIFWDVLDIKDDKLLLCSSYILDAKMYDEDAKAMWVDSSIRKWLNNSFLYWTFETNDELDIIDDTNIVTNGVPTTDKVFLLSSDEINKYFGETKDNKFQNKKLATLANNNSRSKGIAIENDLNKWNYCYSPFWLRDRFDNDKVNVISAEGYLVSAGELPNSETLYGVRPAMWVKLDSRIDNKEFLSFEDFNLYYNDGISKNKKNENAISIFKKKDNLWTQCTSLVRSDNPKTYRGITCDSTINDVIEKYGNAELEYSYQRTDNVLYYYLINTDGVNIKIVNEGDRYLDYKFEYTDKRVYHLRFYFDNKDKVELIYFYYYR